MSVTEDKHYHDEEFDPCCLCETYAGSDRIFNEDAMERIMENVYKKLSSGSVKGDTIIDISAGLFMFQLFVAADYFKDIIMIESSDSSVEEIQKWIKKEPGAIDKSHMAMYACALKGKSTGWKEQEDKLRGAIKQIIKWDIEEENPLGSVVLPQVDCLISVVYLEAVCKDHNMYFKVLKHFSSLLKTGGHLILIAAINATYYMVGQHKFSALKCDEVFVQKAVGDTGFFVKSTDRIERKFDNAVVDYEYLAFIVAYKEREI
ncbi:hypothetical protein GDO86_000014 [Hymenochirus boettgeri]|uniref:Uncharacterized protein n=1 Tax=Hymenochirus boettgeri TaxID=247094 RepID=A0A8T2KF07_9PIPI|nr:hypothetical protein GDO86_012044 [Hymenochirus boettgeri]KAG8453221.1 hypothetical protein GDO86_000014 [Hymenochirus boettgeri]